jgi:hypothetical protein
MNVSINNPLNPRLVRNPCGSGRPNGAFVGWGPKLGSI